MGVAEVFSHHRAVLALGQGVVVGTPAPRAGELPDVQLVEQPGDLMVDELRAVVGMEAFDDEGERAKEGLEHREHEVFADALHRADELELCDLVDQVEVVHTLGTVEVALMDGVHPNENGTVQSRGPAGEYAPEPRRRVPNAPSPRGEIVRMEETAMSCPPGTVAAYLRVSSQIQRRRETIASQRLGVLGHACRCGCPNHPSKQEARSALQPSSHRPRQSNPSVT